jgi:DNA-binding PucR family transcriptional regulator
MSAPHPDLQSLAREVDALRPLPGAPEPVASSRARETATAAARALLPSLDVLTERIRCRLLESWPAFAQTAELELELTDTIETNLRRYFEDVVVGESREVLTAPPEALRFAVSVQHHGIDTGTLIEAYRVGQNIAWSSWMEHLAREVVDHDLLVETIEHSSRRMFAYVDAVVEEQVRIWGRERERWSGPLTARRAAAVRQLVEADSPVSEHARRAVGYSLERELIAAVLWESQAASAGAAPASGAPMGRLELAAEAIAGAVGLERALLVPAGDTCIWAWFASDRRLDLDALERIATEHLRDRQCLALSLPGTGLEGFRGGHRQVLRARRFAELSQLDGGVVRFDEVETLCVMSEDPELLADFVERKLGPLAAESRSAGRLRETLLVWLREGGNASRAAERLRTHKNTVRNRVQRAQELIGRSLDEDRLGLELALTMLQRVRSADRAG